MDKGIIILFIQTPLGMKVLLSLWQEALFTFNTTLLANNNWFGSLVNNNSPSFGPFPEAWKAGPKSDEINHLGAKMVKTVSPVLL